MKQATNNWTQADTIADAIEAKFPYEDLQLDLIEGGHNFDADAIAYYYTSSSKYDGDTIELQAIVSGGEYVTLALRTHEMDAYTHIDYFYL